MRINFQVHGRTAVECKAEAARVAAKFFGLAPESDASWLINKISAQQDTDAFGAADTIWVAYVEASDR